MSEAVLSVGFAGPHVSIQDAGRPGFMRFGVPASGPMDRASFAAANVALGNPPGQPAIEISMGGLALECLSGTVTFAVAGGGFVVEHGGRRAGSWSVATLRAGERLAIRPGHWGNWTYLAFAGRLDARGWLGSLSTHVISGLGGGRLVAGQTLTVAGAELRAEREGAIVCPVTARPRQEVRVVLGPQDRFFARETVAAFLAGPYRLTDAYDRMGVRLQGPALPPGASLDMPSEPIVRGSVQVAGDGVATVLRALGEVLRDQVDTAQLRALAYIAGQSLATVHRLGPCETLADVEEEANKVLLKLDWGWLRIESRAEYVQFTHGCPPLRGWFGAEGMAWSGALFEGVFAEWLRGLGAGEQLDLRQVGDAVGADRLDIEERASQILRVVMIAEDRVFVFLEGQDEADDVRHGLPGRRSLERR